MVRDLLLFLSFLSFFLWHFLCFTTPKRKNTHTKKETYVFDLQAGKFFWARRTLFGLKRKEFWLSEIDAIQVIELSDGQGGGDPNLYLKMTDGSRIKIFSGQLLTWRDRSRVITQKKIRDFLNDYQGHSESTSSSFSSSSSSSSSAWSSSAPDSPVKVPHGGMHRRITGILSRGKTRLRETSKTDSIELQPLRSSAGGDGDDDGDDVEGGDGGNGQNTPGDIL